jgi:hypothetical protein
MIVPLFAMPGFGAAVLLLMGFVLALLLASLFVTATKTRRNPRAVLGVVAILCGPLVGASLAWLANTLGHVYPADVGFTYSKFTVIGAIAGLLAGVAFGVTALHCRRDSGAKAVPAKLADVRDEL